MTTVQADDHGRVQIPGIKAGQKFAPEEQGGKVILTPLTKAKPRTLLLKLVRHEGYLIANTAERRIDPKDIARAVRADRKAQGKRGVRC